MKRYTILYLLTILFWANSCNSWLSLDAEDEIDSDYLLSEAQGFRNALNGIYLNLAEGKLYGRELSWGFLSAISQYYDPIISTEYKAAMEYDYENASVNTIISDIWLNTYNAIANCNNIIANINNIEPGKFELGEEERDLILGEALGVRAMLHFDMLRLFAPAPATNPSGNYIPYFTIYPSTSEPYLTIDDFLGHVIDDLVKARRLVAPHDSLNMDLERLAGRLTGNLMTDKDMFFRLRGTRFNLYAADALLARVYLYAGDKTNAYKHARYIYDSYVQKYNYYDHLRLTPANDITSSILKRSRKLYDGIILGLYNSKLLDLYEEYYNKRGEMPLKNVEEMFEGNEDDYRLVYLITPNNKGHQEALKYMRADEKINNVNSYQGPIIPYIRLSEIYYIMCECLVDTDKKQAVDLLNELRLARGCKTDIPYTVTESTFMDELVYDARKDFIGEGQLFFMYKRLNRPVLDGKKQIQMGNKFILPLPDIETIH
ncbi:MULTISPECIES: RagB/SusD family nutrient uptake outer membrane protein [Porphyromonadaceae]|uniref:RagB/SusD family nutrient uptake outer membrane protein n=1 Tax=Sanguibacteroides justesenii TaxID=1547597 RepID=A0AB34R535_9PORP|nr:MULTISPECIES: RagB/SusD family nutrient uptake outer membrane protein [Porphyromonadaceae]KIO46485.1 hypothetical protein IE90_03780 [Sanguibacteroides justesenii]PXZ42742.1 RagB/SusD family nutrient uptake outer membrane protein [Sanguibacteroides justesenii]